MGKPLKYKTVKALQDAIDKYFEDCKGTILLDADGNPMLDKYSQPVYIGAKPPTVTGLAFALGFKSRQALINYQQRDAYNDALTRAKLYIEAYTEQRLFDRDGVNGAKFSLANNFRGWSEKPMIENDTAEAKPFIIPATAIAPSFISALIDIHNHDHTEYVFKGGRGSTKSSFLSEVIVELIKNNPEINACICRRVAATLRDSVYSQMQWAIETLGLSDEFDCKVSPLEITYKPTGQKIYFRGMDEPAKLKSIKPRHGYIGVVWFEELDQYAGESQIRNAEQSIVRGGDSSYIFKSFNPPKTAANWANKYLQIPKESRYVHHSDYTTVPAAWLGKTFLEEAEHLKAVNPAAYEHEYMGIPNGTGGNVFDNVICKEISRDEIQAFDRIYKGIDWGWYPDPYAYNSVHYDAARGVLYIYDEIHVNKMSNQKTAEMLIDHGVTYDDIITADSAEPKSVGDYKSYGFCIYGAKKGQGSVEYGMKWLQSLTQIVIDPVRCPHTAQEFLNYEYERNKEDEIITGYPDHDNHHIDAVRYAMERVWRRRGE